jgi:hypothetical protein
VQGDTEAMPSKSLGDLEGRIVCVIFSGGASVQRLGPVAAIFGGAGRNISRSDCDSITQTAEELLHWVTGKRVAGCTT